MVHLFYICVLLLITIVIASGGPGSGCTTDYDCSGSLVCEDYICKVPRLGICNPAAPFCAGGLPCIGARTLKKCKEYKLPGEVCNVDPFWLCNPAQSICNADKICKIPVGKSCVGFESACLAPATCQGGVCKVPDPKIPEGGSCFGREDDCADGLECRGRRFRKTCRPPLKPGDRCGRFDMCPEYTECCKRRCKIIDRGVCTDFPKLCKPGLDCIGLGMIKKCKARRLPGEICEQDPFWVCELRSSCVDQGPHLPKRCEINAGEWCEGFEDKCVDGTICEIVRRKKICNPVLEKGDRCRRNGKGGRCGPGLICKRRYCVLVHPPRY